MKEYRYSLEPWTNGPEAKSNKHRCPQCGKLTFVRYIDTVTGMYLDDSVGRCDREESCGYHYPPRAYFQDHPEESCREPMGAVIKREIRKPEQEGRIWTIAPDFCNPSLRVSSSLKEYLRGQLGDAVDKIWERYFVGGKGDGRIIFWQIDEQGRVRTGKVMRYDINTGHRMKDLPGSFSWIHADLKRVGLLPKEWKLHQVLFGSHLLSQADCRTPVCLVESEKTALVCSIFLPNYIWLATGGLENLREESCACLQGRTVILYPDLGGFDKWKMKAERISASIRFQYTVSHILEDNASEEERKEGLDLADYLLKNTCQNI